MIRAEEKCIIKQQEEEDHAEDESNVRQQEEGIKKKKGKKDKIKLNENIPSSHVPVFDANDPTLKARVNKWFSHPLFQQSLITESKSELPDVPRLRPGARKDTTKDSPSVLDDILDSMPKTEREIRKEKRKKAVARTKRKEERLAAHLDDNDNYTAEIVSGNSDMQGSIGEEAGDGEKKRSKRKRDGDLSAMEDEGNDVPLTAGEAARRKLIRDGLGSASQKAAAALGNDQSKAASNTIEIVPAGTRIKFSGVDSKRGSQDFEEEEGDEVSLPARKDDRTYDSDSENYDGHDRAVTLALGTMMLRSSRKKALVDASYNRFAWNDPHDEMKHNKPQLPVPNALLEQVSLFLLLLYIYIYIYSEWETIIFIEIFLFSLF